LPGGRLRRALQWIRWPAAAVLLCVGLLLLLADWNWLREPIARRVSAATGRTFAIHGDLEVRLALRPQVVAHDVVLANADWSLQPVMAQVERVEFRIDLLALLAGRIDLPELRLSRPRLALETHRSGATNWTFSAAPQGERRDFSIGTLAIDEGSATYRASDHTNLAFTLKTLPAGGPPSPFGVELTAEGRWRNLPAAVSASGGSLLTLRGTKQPYPVRASGSVGGTQFSIAGTLLDPLHLRGEQLDFSIAGPDLGLLFPILGVPLPPTGAYKLAGSLDHAGDLWTLRKIRGTLGRSDIEGEVAVDRGRQPQRVTGTLVSRTLVLQDLAGFIGAKVAGERDPARRTRFLAAEPLRLDKLLAADVDMSFRGEKVVTAGLPIERMNAHLVISGGRVRLAPLDFGVAGGTLSAVVDIDGRQPTMATRAQFTARGLRLDRLLPGNALAARDTAVLGGSATLAGTGDSLAAMLASADGDAGVIMQGGSVGELALRMSNLDVANSLVLLVGGDRQVPVRCMVGRFKATAGRMHVQSWVMDTAKVNLTGTGHVDLRDESLHLTVASKSKGFSLASLRGPIAVTGSFLHPVVRPELQEGLLRGGLAVALGVATGGVGALLPLLDAGGARDSDCAALVAQAGGPAAAKVAGKQPVTAAAPAAAR
jgi:uncharacterized protein involved in outer membrane biogenesis